MASVLLNGGADSVLRSGNGIYWVADRRDLTIASTAAPADATNSVLEFKVAAGGPVGPAFDRYQGAQLRDNGATLDVASGGKAGYKFYIDPSWKADTHKQASGVWAVMQNAAGTLPSGGYFSIAEYVDPDQAAVLKGTGGIYANFTGGFRFWTSDKGWVAVTNTSKDGWVDVSFEMGENGHSWVVKQGSEIVATYTDTTASIIRETAKLQTLIVNNENFGQAQSYFYDDISFTGAAYTQLDGGGLVTKSINRGLSPVAKDGDFMINGTGNPAVNFAVTKDAAHNLELALSGRIAYGPTLAGTKDAAGVTHFAATTGEDVRFAYSLASLDDDQLSKYNFKLLVDTSGDLTFDAAAQDTRVFLLQPTQGSASLAGTEKSGYEWVLDWNKDGQITAADVPPGLSQLVRITDDQGNGKVTQNIQNIAWYDNNTVSNSLGVGTYDVKIQAFDKAGGYANQIAESHMVFDVAATRGLATPIGAATFGTALNTVAVENNYLFAGSGNPITGFTTTDTAQLQLGLSVRTAYGPTLTNGQPQSDGSVVFTYTPEHADARFAYSVATLNGAQLGDYNFKLQIDINPGVAATYRTFFLRPLQTDPGREVAQPSGYEWVLDYNNDGFITDADKVGGKLVVIADDEGNLNTHQVTQNIQNIAWYDDNLTSSVLTKGTYDVRLQAFDKGNAAVKAESHIVINVAGGAPVDNGGGNNGGGNNGGGSTPTPNPNTPTPNPNAPTPFVPSTAVDPSPNDGFNEAKASASVATFFTGAAPSAAKQAELNAFANLQFEAYKKAGVLNPAMGPYEALGRGFSETVEFSQKYAALTEAEFITARYVEVFGRDPSAAQQAHFQAQIDYFELIYENAGISSAQADIYAKGAVLGQMIGHAALDPVTATTQASTAYAWDLAA